MLRVRRFSTWLIVGFSLALTTSFAQTGADLPKIEGQSLAGNHIVLPAAASGKIAVLIFGFSKASKTANNAWAHKISHDFTGQSALLIYQLPVIEGAPRFIRGMIVSSMRKEVPENARDHFVPLVQGERELKTFVHYKEPDDAYLVVLDRSGKVIKQAHGPLNEATYAQIREEIEMLLK
jgi:hypothetical protein